MKLKYIYSIEIENWKLKILKYFHNQFWALTSNQFFKKINKTVNFKLPLGKTNKYRWNLWHKWTIPTNKNIHKLKIDARYMDGIEKYGWNHMYGWKWPSCTFIYLLMWGLHMKLPPSPINLLPSLLESPTYLPSWVMYIVKIMMYVYEVYIYTYLPLQKFI
jgi:hypothetical protein